MLNRALPTESAMMSLAAKIANVVEEGAIIFLYGPLGAGKTTFTRGFLRGLGYVGKVKSPTYTLVEPYDVKGRSIIHFDFYRLQDAKELEQLGVRDYFSPEAICLIEWPERGDPLLPHPDLACSISFSGTGRDIRMEARSRRGEMILKRFSGSDSTL